MSQSCEYNGIPYRGIVYDFKNADRDELKPVLKHVAHAKMFNMSKPDDVKEYEEVLNQHMSGRAVIGIEQTNFDSSKSTYFVYVRWAEMYYTNPPLEVINDKVTSKKQEPLIPNAKAISN